MNYHPWVAFGDSLTYGYALEEKDTWVSRVERHFGRKIINLGIPGETSSDGRKRFEEVLKNKPELVFLNFGTNDQTHTSFHQPKVDVHTYRENLQNFITKLQSVGSQILLITPHRIIEEERIEEKGHVEDIQGKSGIYFYGRHPKAYYQGTSPNKVLAFYVEVLQDLACEYKVPILDLYHSKRMDNLEEVLISSKNSALYDGVHYSKKGAEVVSEEIIREVEKTMMNDERREMGGKS